MMVMRITCEEKHILMDRLEDVQNTYAEMTAAVAAYNEAVGEVHAWRDDVVDRLDNEWYDASESWQSSENGERYGSGLICFKGSNWLKSTT